MFQDQQQAMLKSWSWNILQFQDKLELLVLKHHLKALEHYTLEHHTSWPINLMTPGTQTQRLSLGPLTST